MKMRGLLRIWIETQAGGISPLTLNITKGLKMEKLEKAKMHFESSIESLSRSCAINDLKTGDGRVIDRALDILESMVKEAKKARKMLNEAEARVVRRAMR